MEKRKISKEYKGSPSEAVLLIADGNIGATTVLLMFVTRLIKQADFPKSIIGSLQIEGYVFMRLNVIDRFRLYGEKFWNFYVNDCKRSPDNLSAFVHAYLHPQFYPGIREKLTEWFERGKKFDFEKLFSEVKQNNPEVFESIQVQEGPVTTDMVSDLKAKFNRSN